MARLELTVRSPWSSWRRAIAFSSRISKRLRWGIWQDPISIASMGLIYIYIQYICIYFHTFTIKNQPKMEENIPIHGCYGWPFFLYLSILHHWKCRNHIVWGYLGHVLTGKILKLLAFGGSWYWSSLDARGLDVSWSLSPVGTWVGWGWFSGTKDVMFFIMLERESSAMAMADSHAAAEECLFLNCLSDQLSC